MDIKTEIIELQTICILLDDKIHKIQEILSRAKKRLHDLEELYEREKVPE